MEEYLKIKQMLEENGQEHLLKYYQELNKEEKESLIKQIEEIDFEQIADLYNKTKIKNKLLNDIIEPIAYMDKEKMTEDMKKYYSQIGEKSIKNNEYAVVTMAGGQGTRLGHTGPKGTYDIGLDSHKSIFEILCDTLKQANNEYGVKTPWYIMTSRENNEATVKFFEENNYFDYGKENIRFFIQSEMPMLNEEGKIILEEKGKIKKASDGHGGIFSAMMRQQIISDMQKRNVKWVFINGVDNILAKMVDALLLGIAIDKKMLAAGKSVVKCCPEEKVGVFCKRNGRPSVVEYTEITKEMSEERDENGELLFGESHILCNLFNIQTIIKANTMKFPYHIAFKKANYINENGELIKPEKPNAYKFESFLFDVFGILDDMTILRVKREEEFAPIKNAEGADSPETARKLYLNFHKLN